MANIYLKLDGIAGESTAQNFQGWIELESFSFSGNVPILRSLNAEATAGKVAFSALTIVKKPDSASPHLFLDMCAGTHLATGTVAVAPAAGQPPSLKIDLIQVLVVSMEGSYASAALSEQIGLSCAAIQYTYSAPILAGKLTAPVIAGWNLATNTKA